MAAITDVCGEDDACDHISGKSVQRQPEQETEDAMQPISTVS